MFEGATIGMLVPFLQTFANDAASFPADVEWGDTSLLGTNLGGMSGRHAHEPEIYGLNRFHRERHLW